MTGDLKVEVAFRRSAFFGLAIFFFILFGIAFYYWWPSQPDNEQTLESPLIRQLPQAKLPVLPLRDITESSGITFVHENGARGEKLLPETMGGGCAFFDMDNDGDQDLLLINSTVWPEESRDSSLDSLRSKTSELYENDGTGSFQNVTAGSGFDIPLYGMGCACGDYDADGLTDVYITCVGPNVMFRNLGGGRFQNVTDTTGLSGGDSDWGTSCGWFDYDGDGDLDLFVCNYLDWSREYDAAQEFRLTETRGYGRPQAFGGTFLSLFRNENSQRFEDVSEEAGLHLLVSPTGQPMAKALGLAFFDFDGDQDLDVLVANDTVPNFLLENQGDGTFRETGTAVGVAYDSDGNARGAMGVDVTSFRNAKSVGVAIGNFSNEMSALYVTAEGECLFTDEAMSSGLGPQTRMQLTFGIVFADLDLDQRPDIIAANGHLEDEIHRVLPSQTYEQPPHLFWNAGPASSIEFIPLSRNEVGEDFFQKIVGRGCAYADIDSDGDLDILLTSLHGSPKLFRNEQTLDRHWIRVKLLGKSPNQEAIGARIRVETKGAIQEKIVMPTRGYLSQSELPVHFGLGSAENIEKLTVLWPDGQMDVLEDVEVNQLQRLRQEN